MKKMAYCGRAAPSTARTPAALKSLPASPLVLFHMLPQLIVQIGSELSRAPDFNAFHAPRNLCPGSQYSECCSLPHGQIQNFLRKNSARCSYGWEPNSAKLRSSLWVLCALCDFVVAVSSSSPSTLQYLQAAAGLEDLASQLDPGCTRSLLSRFVHAL